MNISTDEYYFCEWLIFAKKIDSEIFDKLTNKEIEELRKEYIIFRNKLK